MKNLLERDKIKRALFSRKEPSRIALKYIFSNKQLPLKVRWLASIQLTRLPLKSSPVRIKNRCSETFRNNSAFRDFRLSRIFFRDYVRFGQISGVTKKSW
jgi:small subunit ribosomal protein S14